MKFLLAIAVVAFIAIVESKPSKYYHTTKKPYYPVKTPRPAKDCKGYSSHNKYSSVCSKGYYHGQYFEYDGDCTCFIQCEWGTSHLRPCAPGTHWDQKLKTCAHGTDCSTKYTKPPTYKPPAYYTRKSEDCKGYKKDDNFCSKQYSYYNFYHEYPSDCSCYYQCDAHGNTFTKPCAKGTVWDQSKKTCVRPCPDTCKGRYNPVKINLAYCSPKSYYYGDEVEEDVPNDFEDEAEE